ncbi:MGH1-like glycoside hydrolase domain-containing protein [Treponema pectinovorum]|uniref:MGH1-like glycoside hydrolase domain-containing protein n=1 Tax=Treponema pectinovorum TaxID=164 RepID=UPI0011C777D3|nr:trehalase family glycosidase [Treponema pectinovorum]
MNKRDFPKIHFYDQDFVDIYDKTWAWLSSFWIDTKLKENANDGYFVYPQDKNSEPVLSNPTDAQTTQKIENATVDQFESIFSSFFLVYSNRNFPANQNLDYFYNKQEANGAIRWKYDLKTGDAVTTPENPEGIGLPLFAWAEFNLYHKSANKRRIKDIMPILQKYMDWVDQTYKQPNGLYSAPVSAGTMFNSPRKDCYYSVDFNASVAINCAHMSALGDILNDKDLSFQYKRAYFSLKTRINSLMWDAESKFYYDLDKDEQKLSEKTIAGFWPLLAEIPNADKADLLIEHLSNPQTFGTDHPFPTLSADSPNFNENGNGFCGSVYPAFNFMIIKGLEKYQRYDLARECAIRHLYFVLEALQPADGKKGDMYEAYKPCKEGYALMDGNSNYPRVHYLQTVGLSTIALMIENVIGLSISLPRKTVDWIIPNLEIMGIEKLSLKRNLITILSNKSVRGWEIQMESEKLYYFTINILDQKKKTLPIPSGKCSMLIDKL